MLFASNYIKMHVICCVIYYITQIFLRINIESILYIDPYYYKLCQTFTFIFVYKNILHIYKNCKTANCKLKLFSTEQIRFNNCILSKFDIFNILVITYNNTLIRSGDNIITLRINIEIRFMVSELCDAITSNGSSEHYLLKNFQINKLIYFYD